MRLKGTTRMEIRAPRARNKAEDTNVAAGGADIATEASTEESERKQSEQREAKRRKVESRRLEDSLAIDLDSDSDIEEVGSTLMPKLQTAVQVQTSQTSQILRISAGRAAAAAGIHPFADTWEVFVELLYQDQPELLLMDAARAGIEVVSPAAERARLLSKSGEASNIEAALARAKEAAGIEGLQHSQEAVRVLLQVAEKAKRLTAAEIEDLRSILQSEMNCEFGARHEDAAIDAYALRVRAPVYGQQRRVSVPLPAEPTEALTTVFPMPGIDGCSRGQAGAEAKPFFRLTGFVDGMVDLPRESCASVDSTAPKDTLVVEVKHRMGKIQDPPHIYDIVQLGSYCRALGCSAGHLVQCLRAGVRGAATDVGTLHVTRLDFSEGSRDRQGWDKHVLPSLYKTASAVYEVRKSPEARIRLLAASPLGTSERGDIIAELCPHLAR